jgi:uncharacterized RDD family membrane protein YckC
MAATPSSSTNRWPGERLRRPESGRGSVARAGRRIGAILIDFALCFVVYSMFFFGNSWASLTLFVIEQYVFLVLFGGSIGHLALGLRLTKLDGDRAGFWRPAVRTLLLAAVIWDADQRGLHDVFPGTVLVRI